MSRAGSLPDIQPCASLATALCVLHASVRAIRMRGREDCGNRPALAPSFLMWKIYPTASIVFVHAFRGFTFNSMFNNTANDQKLILELLISTKKAAG